MVLTRMEQLRESNEILTRETKQAAIDAVRAGLMQRDVMLVNSANAREGALVCVENSTADLVDANCEKLIYLRVNTLLSIVAHVEARLDLLRDAYAAAQRDTSLGPLVERLRIPLELDRWGIVAQLLMMRDSCQPGRCRVSYLFRDFSKIEEHMRQRTFEKAYVKLSITPVMPSQAPNPALPPSSGRGSPVPPNFPLPGPESMPAVNIMSPEPAVKPAPPAAAPAPKVTPAPRAVKPATPAAPKPATPPTPINPPQEPDSTD
jgi:hypothetical protein